jgi:AraC-like DNA-binding protein
VIAPEQAVATLLRETAGLPPWAVVGGPAHLAEILERITIAMAFGADARVAMPRLRPAVVAAAEHVSRHYRERLLIEDLARAAGVSTEQLGHVFREGLGITAKEFVARFRINAACHMLGDADHKLEHIAELTGFEDASHLSRVFTRRLGMRPGEYRRRLESVSVHPTPARFARRPSPSRGG